ALMAFSPQIAPPGRFALRDGPCHSSVALMAFSPQIAPPGRLALRDGPCHSSAALMAFSPQIAPPGRFALRDGPCHSSVALMAFSPQIAPPGRFALRDGSKLLKHAGAAVGDAYQAPETGKQFAAHAPVFGAQILAGGGAGEKFLFVAQEGQGALVGVEPDHVAIADLADRAAVDSLGGHVDGGGHLA